MFPSKARRDRVRNGQTQLEEAVRRLSGKGPESLSPEQWEGLCQQLCLQALYPGQYVAWRDHVEGEGNNHRLVRREILLASPRESVVSKYLARLAIDELDGVFMGYIASPEETPSRV